MKKNMLLVMAFILVLMVSVVSSSKPSGTAGQKAAAQDDLEQLPEILPIGGMVMPATMVTKKVGKSFVPGDVIMFIGGIQSRGTKAVPAGSVQYFRAGAVRRVVLDNETDVGGVLVMVFTKIRENSDAHLRDVITSINGVNFNTEEEFLKLALQAQTIQFMRGGVPLSRWSSLSKWSGQFVGNAKANFGGGKISLEDPEPECTPNVRGFCAYNGLGQGFCVPDDPGTYCPCKVCGGGGTTCCQGYQ